jgi:CubicO group peptidase (beta-lactamase class C family)
MTMARTALLTLVAFTMTVRLIAQGPIPEIKARVDTFVAALGSGDAGQYEAMAQDAFAPDLLAKRSAADRKAFVERIRADFGALTVQRVRRAPDGPHTIHVRGATGLEGRIELTIEEAPPYRIIGIGVEVGEPEEGSEGEPPPIRATMSEAELRGALDAWLAPMASADRFAGVVLVAKNGATVFEKAYGLADRDRRTPITANTRFNLGSINKIFTKTAIARLMSEGKIRLTDTLGALLPDYPNAAAKSATVEQLLEHRGGIADFFGESFSDVPKDRLRSNADYLALVSAKPLLFAPGTQRRYCNGCYIVLGAIIERLAGVAYEDYIARNVFAPAGMTGAGFFHSDRLPADTARGYTRRGRQGDDAPHDNASMHGAAGSAAGGGYASARDLLAFDIALRAGRLLDAKGTTWLLGGDGGAEGAVGGRRGGGLGIAGGAPGVNAVLESSQTWTVTVVGNLDPPAAERLGVAIHRQLTR